MSFEFDDENQATAIEPTSYVRTEFTYDALGRRRIRKEYDWDSQYLVWSLTE